MSKNKILILQTDINHGTQWGDDTIMNFLREYCIPSVKKYALKNDYDYLLIKDSIYEDEIGKFDFLPTKLKHYAFERYYHLSNDYDSTVYLDNDIYIFDEAIPLPQINCLMCALEPDGNSSNIFRQVNNLSHDYPYYNSGVIMGDNKSLSHLANYMLHRMKNYIRAKGKNTDNMMLNEYLLEHNYNFSKLDNHWNYMPFLPNSPKLNNVNFFHFVGIHGKKLIAYILKNKFEVNHFLKNATFEFKKK